MKKLLFYYIVMIVIIPTIILPSDSNSKKKSIKKMTLQALNAKYQKSSPSSDTDLDITQSDCNKVSEWITKFNAQKLQLSESLSEKFNAEDQTICSPFSPSNSRSIPNLSPTFSETEPQLSPSYLRKLNNSKN